MDDIVAEATTAVDLASDTDVADKADDAEPATESIQLPADVLVLSDDDDDIPVQNLTISGATADPVKDYLKQIGKVALLCGAAHQEVMKHQPGDEARFLLVEPEPRTQAMRCWRCASSSRPGPAS